MRATLQQQKAKYMVNIDLDASRTQTHAKYGMPMPYFGCGRERESERYYILAQNY